MNTYKYTTIFGGGRRSELVFHGFFLLLSLVPILGFVIHGTWDQVQLGLAVMVAFFTSREMIRYVLETRRGSRGKG
ncbi:MAG: hypothetical protein L6Q76_12740 [Polyangiaceae bacterium]|nr:hypothetical protein [Polyangiaceae bacterium]